MTETRHTVDTITSDQLDALQDRVAKAERAVNLLADAHRRAETAEQQRDQLKDLLGEAVGWIHEGELRERICAVLNGREEQPTHPFRQHPEADVHVCADCGKWPAHHLHTSDSRSCGCDRCRA